jgi:ribonuclease G
LALHLLGGEGLPQELEKAANFPLELRDPMLRPDEFKLVVKGAGRDVTTQYAVA